MNISRFVLSDVTPLGAHVIETKNLLEDISEVAITNDNETILITEDSIEDYRFKFEEFNITDISFYNVHENKSIVTMFFNSEVDHVNNSIFYTKIKDFTLIEKNNLLVYIGENELKTGKFQSIDYEIQKYTLIDTESDKIIDVEENDILGVVFHIKND